MSVDRAGPSSAERASGGHLRPEAATIPASSESLEDSPEGFVNRWRGRAAQSELFARPEGVPLIECRVADAVIQVFERTGPYLSRPGPNRLIVNPTVARLTVVAAGERRLEALGLSRLAAAGRVLEVDGRTVVVDAGEPLVVTSREPLPPGVVPGATVSFESDAPVHGFVVVSDRTSFSRREAVDESI